MKLPINKAGASVCVLGLSTMKNFELFIFGNVFLREYYSVWDMTQDRLGLAPQIHSSVPPIIPGALDASSD